MITIDIVSDTICPWCFIGKRRLERAIEERPPKDEVRISWLPFQLNPDMPEEGADRKSYLEAKFGGPDAARQVYGAIEEAGRTVGIDFRFDRIERTPNTVLSHRLVDRAGQEGVQNALVTRLFEAYFLEGRDMGDVEVLTEVAAEAGMDPEITREYLESGADADRIRAEDAQAREAGVQGVPFFIFNRKYAVSGAQDPEVFKQVFDMLEREEAEPSHEPQNSA